MLEAALHDAARQRRATVRQPCAAVAMTGKQHARHGLAGAGLRRAHGVGHARRARRWRRRRRRQAPATRRVADPARYAPGADRRSRSHQELALQGWRACASPITGSAVGPAARPRRRCPACARRLAPPPGQGPQDRRAPRRQRREQPVGQRPARLGRAAKGGGHRTGDAPGRQRGGDGTPGRGAEDRHRPAGTHRRVQPLVRAGATFTLAAATCGLQAGAAFAAAPRALTCAAARASGPRSRR